MRPEPDTALYALPGMRPFAERVAAAANLPLYRVARHTFPDGELLPRVPTPAALNALLVHGLYQPNAKILEASLVADALRRAGAKRVILIAPYLPYMRQDQVFHPGEPLSQKVFGRILRLGFDRVLTVEPHLHRVHRLSEVVPGRAISAAPAIARWLEVHLPDAWIVGPDAESERWVRPIAQLLARPWMVGEKERQSDLRVRLRFPPLPPGSKVALVDDIASSGGTFAAAARKLRQAGAQRIAAIVVHAIFAPGSLSRLRSSGIARVVSCDTVPHPTNRISCVPEIAKALGQVR